MPLRYLGIWNAIAVISHIGKLHPMKGNVLWEKYLKFLSKHRYVISYADIYMRYLTNEINLFSLKGDYQ